MPPKIEHGGVRAMWEGKELGQGTGRSKKQAETAAAEEALKLKRWKKGKRDRT
jgi:dsRNA-specific ribonuclease